MKIGSSDSPQPLATTTLSTSRATTAEGQTATAKAGAAPDASAQVALSSTATSLLQGASADFDAEKVSKVSAAIAEGSFKPNPEAIADKLIANAQELLNKTSSA